MHDDEMKMLSYRPAEMHLLEDFECGAGYLGAVHDVSSEVDMAPPAVVFLMSTIKQLGAGEDGATEEVRLVLGPEQAGRLGVALVEMGAQAARMPSMSDAPVDIVDRA